MASPIFMSRPPAGFSMLAVLRGLQLTLLGAIRALQNPYLSKSFYRKAFIAILLSVLIQVILWLPLWTLQTVGSVLSWFTGQTTDLQFAIDTCQFMEDFVLNIDFFLILVVRYTRPEMDELFLSSLQYVDDVYKTKHPEATKQYYAPLQNYTGGEIQEESTSLELLLKDRRFRKFLQGHIRRSAITLALYMLSGSPVIGPFVLPVATFYSLNQVAGTPTAITAFCFAFAATPEYTVMFLSTFWGGRCLVNELLSPYFARVPFSRSDKEQWFKAREGIMFGFGCGFCWLLKTPYAGVLIYGIAEASTAYLISKISEPPPAPGPQLFKWVENEVVWTAQSQFLSGVTLENDGFGYALPLGPVDW